MSAREPIAVSITAKVDSAVVQWSPWWMGWVLQLDVGGRSPHSVTRSRVRATVVYGDGPGAKTFAANDCAQLEGGATVTLTCMVEQVADSMAGELVLNDAKLVQVVREGVPA